MLEEQAPLESIIDWLDAMVDKCVVKVPPAFTPSSPRCKPRCHSAFTPL